MSGAVGPTFLDGDRVADPCPACGGKVRYDLGCHTWGGKPDGTGWMACLPCGSAFVFDCVGEDTEDGEGCGWTYTWGLNPRNPKSVGNEERRPLWIEVGSRPPL